MEGNLSDILLPLTLFPLTGFIVWIGVTNSRRLKMARLQAEMQEKLLERLGSNQELLPYLESDAGRRFLEAATTEKTNPHRRILSSMQSGIVLVFLGLALVFARLSVGAAELRFVGTLFMALGTGFLVSSGLSFWLSKSWGLINGDQESANL